METWLTPSLIVALLALVLGALNSYYTRKRDNQKAIEDLNKKVETEIEELKERLGESEASLKVLKMQMELFWKTVEQQMAKKFRDE